MLLKRAQQQLLVVVVDSPLFFVGYPPREAESNSRIGLITTTNLTIPVLIN